MQMIESAVERKLAVLKRLKAELAEATRMYAVATPHSEAEVYYRMSMATLNASIQDIKQDINVLRS